MSADETVDRREDEGVVIDHEDHEDHSIILSNRREDGFRTRRIQPGYQEQDSCDSMDSSDSFPIDLFIKMCSEPVLLFLVKIMSSIITERGLDEAYASLREQKQKQYEKETHILNSKVDALKQRLASKSTQVCESCKDGRRNNLRIYGWPEKTGEVTDDEVISIVAKIGVTLKQSDIERSHRIGKLGRWNSANRSRPILVKLRSYMSKREIMVNARKLKGHTRKVFINEDFTKEQDRIASATRRLVKCTQLAGTWVQDGIIHAKKRDGHVVLLTRKNHLDELMQSLNRKRKLKSFQSPVAGPIIPSGSRLPSLLLGSRSGPYQSPDRVLPWAHQAHHHIPTMADNSSGQQHNPVPESMSGPNAFTLASQASSVYGTTRADNFPSQQSDRLETRQFQYSRTTSEVQRSFSTEDIRLSDLGATRGDNTDRKTPAGQLRTARRTCATAGPILRSGSSPAQREEQDECNGCNTSVDWLMDTTGADLLEKKEEIMYMIGRDDALSPMKTGFGLLQMPQWKKDKIWGTSGDMNPTRVRDTLRQLSANHRNIGHIVHYFVQERSKRLDIVKLIMNIHQECPYCDPLYRIHIPQTPT